MIAPTKSGAWNEEEDQLLVKYQGVYGNKWSQVSQHIPGRTGQQCAQRWRHKVNPQIIREKWTPEEDRLLADLVQQLGVGKWASISRHLPGRTDQQCMGRWRRHLDPNIRKDAWTVEEDEQLRALYLQHGPAWSCIAKSISKRTPQQCRGRWCILAACNSKTLCSARLEGGTTVAHDSDDEPCDSTGTTSSVAMQALSRPSSRSKRVGPESDAPLREADSTPSALQDLQETPSKEVGINFATRMPTQCRRRYRLQRTPIAGPQDSRDDEAEKPAIQEEGVEQSGITILSRCRRGRLLLGSRIVSFRRLPRSTNSKPRTQLLGFVVPSPKIPHNTAALRLPQSANSAEAEHNLVCPLRESLGFAIAIADQAALLSGLMDDHGEKSSRAEHNTEQRTTHDRAVRVNDTNVPCVAVRTAEEEEAERPRSTRSSAPSTSANGEVLPFSACKNGRGREPLQHSGDALHLLAACRTRGGHCFPLVDNGGNTSQPLNCASARAACTDTEASTAVAERNEVAVDLQAGFQPPAPQPLKQVGSCQVDQPDTIQALPAHPAPGDKLTGAKPDWSQIASVSPTSSMMSLLQAGLIQTPTCSPGMFPNPDVLCAPVPPGMPKVQPTFSNGWSDVSPLSWSELRNCKDDFGQTHMSSQVTPDNTRPVSRLAQDVNQTSTTPRRDMFMRPPQLTAAAGSLWRSEHGLLDDETPEFEGTADCQGVTHSLASPSASIIGDPGACHDITLHNFDGIMVDTHRVQTFAALPPLGSFQTSRPAAKARAGLAGCNANNAAGEASTPRAGYSFLPFSKKTVAAQFPMPPGLAYAALMPSTTECAGLEGSRASSGDRPVLADEAANVIMHAAVSTATIPAMDSRYRSLVSPLDTVSQPAVEVGPSGQLPRLVLPALDLGQPRQHRITSLFPVLKLADFQGRKFPS